MYTTCVLSITFNNQVIFFFFFKVFGFVKLNYIFNDVIKTELLIWIQTIHSS
jgi:hypothetical protein